MLKILRLKAIIKTTDKDFGFDHKFSNGLNLISSNENTKGKSSIIEAIYYCLGIEELLGGRNERALKPVFKTRIDYNETAYIPYETNFFLEVQNKLGKIITINRSVEKVPQNNALIRVYNCIIDEVKNNTFEELYVHISGAATSEKGFHKYLEDFLGIELPSVPTYDDSERKLYIQTLFSAMFIEQKRGWSNLLSTLPNFGIKEAKRKVIEYILNLDTINNDKIKTQCKIQEGILTSKWTSIIKKIDDELSINYCWIQSLASVPKILDEKNLENLQIYKKLDNSDINIDNYINTLFKEQDSLSQQNLKVGTNIEDLQNDMEELKEEINVDEKILDDMSSTKILENNEIKALKENLEIINRDLNNNEDAKKLKSLGALFDSYISKDICPTCHQNIEDCLLEQNHTYTVMTLEENIKHLKEQKAMLEFAIDARKKNIINIDSQIVKLTDSIRNIKRKIRTIVNDIYSTDESFAETIVYKKVEINNEIENINILKRNIKIYINELILVSNEWKILMETKNKLPKKIFTETDKNKISDLENIFTEKLKNYGYESINNISDIEISKDRLIPSVYGFDLTSDCSASDNIRVIWAFTAALLLTSLKNNGNHFNLLIFDEPLQQSIDEEDLCKFIDDLINIPQDCQIFVAITLNNSDIKKYIEDINDCNIILIQDKAIGLL